MIKIRKFRPDIEILRAIAVFAVILAHSKLTLEGGFIGVDIFFVISGFLITKHLHDEVHSSGNINLKSFYGRRILRILPASMLVLILTIHAAFIWLSPLQLVNYGWDALLSSVSGINYRLAVSGTDYFGTTTVPSPFQHFWSLAVEEQFYLIWPLLILVIAKIFIRKQRSVQINPKVKADNLIKTNLVKVSMGNLSSDIIIPIDGNTKLKTKNTEELILRLESKGQYEDSNFKLFKNTVSCILLLIIITSLYLSYRITSESQPWAYFGLHTRAWQLAVGAIIAFNTNIFAKIPSKFASILSWVGFFGIILGFTVINEKSVYPGLLSIIPTLSTAIVIAAGMNITPKSFETVFDNRLTRWIGKISYSWYLIHWPIFVIVFYILGNKIKAIDRISLILITFMLASLSYLFIENHLRFSKVIKSSFKNTYIVGLSLVLLASAVSIGFINKKIRIGNLFGSNIVIEASESTIYQKIDEATKLTTIPKKLVTPLPDVLEDRPKIGCIADKLDLYPKKDAKCTTGDRNSDKIIILLGDSHAYQWVESLDKVAIKNNYKLITFTKPGCPIEDVIHIDPVLKREYTECYSWRAEALAQIEKIHPDIIVSAGIGYENFSTEKYTEFILKLKSYAKKVFRFVDNPKPDEAVFIPECLTKNKSEIQKCSLPNPHLSGSSVISDKESKISTENNIGVIDTYSWLCNINVCPPIIDNIVVYEDNTHISNTYAKYLSDLLNLKIFKDQNFVIQRVQEATKINSLPSKLVVAIEKTSTDYLEKCKDEVNSTIPTEENKCILGNKSGSKSIVLLGDSHAQQWIKPLDSIALKYGYKLFVYAKSSCSMMQINQYNKLINRDYTECTTWRNEAINQIELLRPSILISSEMIYEESSPEKYTEFINKLKTISDKVVKIIDTPRPPESVPECLVKNMKEIQKCSNNLSSAIFLKTKADEESQINKDLKINVIDTLPWFCSDLSCPVVIDNIVVFRDVNYITQSYALYLTSLIESAVQPILKY